MRQAARSGEVDRDLAESDPVEVIRALLGARLTVRASAELDDLTQQARKVLAAELGSAPGSSEPAIRRALGVRDNH